MERVDTVGDRYYKPMALSEKIGSALFWLISLLSVAVLFQDKAPYKIVVSITQILLIIFVVLFFIQGQAQKLYFAPRAEDRRRQQLISNSFNVPLTHEDSIGYYNNDQTYPIKRLAASVMESVFFTREICTKMLPGQRTKVAGYILVYVAATLNRSTDLNILVVAAQTLFGGEIIARWLRMEWLRMRCEQAFENLNMLFNSRPTFKQPVAQSAALVSFAFYETTKSTAAIPVSSTLFQRHNPSLTKEWDKIRSRLNL